MVRLARYLRIREKNSFQLRQSSEQIERRIQSERFGALLGLMESCRAAPHLELRFMSEIQGLDYVASLRKTPHEDGVPPANLQ